MAFQVAARETVYLKFINILNFNCKYFTLNTLRQRLLLFFFI